VVDILGAVSLWGFGVVIGIIGVMALIYWIADEWRDADDATEVVEGVGERSGSAIVVVAGVALTIGDQLIQLVADLVGLIDAPVVVGHVVGGILGYLGLQGTISTSQFLVGFAIVTVVALVWRASMTRGRGL
jgi:hypothetical protein